MYLSHEIRVRVPVCTEVYVCMCASICVHVHVHECARNFVAVCCSALLQCARHHLSLLLQCVAVCCSVLQCVAVRCTMCEAVQS